MTTTNELRIDGKTIEVYEILSSVDGLKAVRMASMPCGKLNTIGDIVLSAIRQGGNNITEPNQIPTGFFPIGEDEAIKLSLIFLTISPLSRVDRIEAIVRGVSGMHPVHRLYWFGLFARNRRAKKALRILLSGK